MNKILLLLVAMILAACGRSEPVDTAQSLMSNPSHLRDVEQLCANNDAKVSASVCRAASEARHRLFLGNGPQYTPPKDPPKF